VNNVESDLSGGNPEVEIKVDPEKAAKAGLSPVVVSGSLGSLLGESTVTTLGDTPVVVGVPQGSVDSLDEVRGLPVGSDTTVGDVAEVGEVESPAAVSRTNGSVPSRSRVGSPPQTPRRSPRRLRRPSPTSICRPTLQPRSAARTRT
jgi:multidrug efflux pump subunit AcrB